MSSKKLTPKVVVKTSTPNNSKLATKGSVATSRGSQLTARGTQVTARGSQVTSRKVTPE